MLCIYVAHGDAFPVGRQECAQGKQENMATRKIARILADLEDQLVDEGLSEEQAEKLVNAIEQKIDKALDEIDLEDESEASEDPDEPSG